MSIHRIFHGGNKRNLPWEQSLGAGNTHHTVRYASHLKRRNFTVEYNLDFGHEEVQAFLRDAAGSAILPMGDELHTHLLAAGSDIRKVVVQVKRAVTGTATIKLHGEAALVAASPNTDEATDDTADTTGTAGNDAVVSILGTVDLSKTGWTVFEADKFLVDEGAIGVSFAQAMGAGCISIYVDLVDYASEHACECALPACNTQVGEPIDCPIIPA